jgi:uncharacterized membrane protein
MTMPLLDVSPVGSGSEFLVIVAVVVLTIALVAAVVVGTGLFVFVRRRRNRSVTRVPAPGSPAHNLSSTPEAERLRPFGS